MNKLKKKPVDYRGFSLRQLNEPRFSHVKLLGGWIFYFTMYFVTENLIPREACHPIHCALDDLIPFNEFFLIFYVGWYAFVFGALAYTFFYDVENFRKLQIFIICTQVIAMTCYVLYPSRQDLRPEVFERENVLTALMAFIYSFDTGPQSPAGVEDRHRRVRVYGLPGGVLCQAAFGAGRVLGAADVPCGRDHHLWQGLLAAAPQKRAGQETDRMKCTHRMKRMKGPFHPAL